MKRTSFKILIVESLSPGDIYSNRREGIAISEMLNILDRGSKFKISSKYKVVIDIKYLRQAIQFATRNQYSIIHLSAHGNSQGIQLTAKNASLNWDELATMIRPFASEKRGVILSCCQAGNFGITKYLRDRRNKLGFVIGPMKNTPFSDSLIAWSIFYKVMSQKGVNRDAVRSAVIAMRKAAEGDFICRYWDKTKKGYFKLSTKSNSH